MYTNLAPKITLLKDFIVLFTNKNKKLMKIQMHLCRGYIPTGKIGKFIY